MRKLIFFMILMCVTSSLFSQENDKLYIEIVGDFISTTGMGLIDKIERNDINTTLFISTNNKISHVVLRNSKINESFLSYINTGDMINLKEIDNEKKIAIFKRQNDSVKVKIFYIMQ